MSYSHSTALRAWANRPTGGQSYKAVQWGLAASERRVLEVVETVTQAILRLGGLTSSIDQSTSCVHATETMPTACTRKTEDTTICPPPQAVSATTSGRPHCTLPLISATLPPLFPSPGHATPR
jgi:hypothetical protein